MKVFTPSPVSPEVVKYLRNLISSGATRAKVIAEMRTSGLHKVESIKVFHTLYRVSLTDAKVAVHYSETWADRRESDDTFHESVAGATQEFGLEAASNNAGEIS